MEKAIAKLLLLQRDAAVERGGYRRFSGKYRLKVGCFEVSNLINTKIIEFIN